jgi:hypothetical protein
MRFLLAIFILGCLSAPLDKTSITEVKQTVVGPNCAETAVIMLEGAVWDTSDILQMSVSKKRCIEKFENSPCLRVYTKVGTGGNIRYRMICGEEKR